MAEERVRGDAAVPRRDAVRRTHAGGASAVIYSTLSTLNPYGR